MIATIEMTLKKSLVPVLALLLGLSLIPAVQAEDQELIIQHTPLRGSLHMLQARGGNVVASIGDSGILLVDDDYADVAPGFEPTLYRLSKSEAAPVFVLNTHWHDDHAGGNEHWGQRGSVIVAHHNVRERKSTRQEMKALGRVVEPSPAKALPVVTFADAMALHFNGSDIELQHYAAGHTDGDSVVYFPQENVVHMGDLFFRDRFPFIDSGSGGSLAGYTANVAAVLARTDDQTLIVPGHGGLASRKDLQRYQQMLLDTAAAVQGAIDAGQSLEQLLEEGLGEAWASWGKGFISEEVWIRTLYAGLSQ